MKMDSWESSFRTEVSAGPAISSKTASHNLHVATHVLLIVEEAQCVRPHKACKRSQVQELSPHLQFSGKLPSSQVDSDACGVGLGVDAVGVGVSHVSQETRQVSRIVVPTSSPH